MKTQHTPGPWRIEGPDNAIVANRPDNSGLPLCIGQLFAPIHDGKRYDMLQANARLIAAAPEMLAALAPMLGAAEADCMDDKSNVWRSMMIDARAAIAKATGAP